MGVIIVIHDSHYRFQQQITMSHEHKENSLAVSCFSKMEDSHAVKAHVNPSRVADQEHSSPFSTPDTRHAALTTLALAALGVRDCFNGYDIQRVVDLLSPWGLARWRPGVQPTKKGPGARRRDAENRGHGITMNMGNGDFEWDDGTGAVTSLDLDMTHVGTAQNSYDIVIYVRRYNSTTGSKDLVNDDVLLESWNGSVGTSYNRIRYVSSTTVSFRYIMSMYLDVEYYATYRLFLEDHPAGASSTETDATHVGVYEVSSTGPQVTSQFYAVSSDGLGNKYVDITNGPTVSSTDSWYFIGFSSESGVNATGEEWSHHFLVDVDGGEGYNHTATVA